MRNYKRKTERGLIPKTVMIQAAKEVLLLKKSNRSVANNYGIPRTTLVRFCSKIEIEDLKNDDLVKIHVGYEAMKKVFSFQQEHDLINFINQSRINSNSNSNSEGNYNDELTGRQLRKFAYEYAVNLGIKYPSSWSNNKMAGPEWLSAFLRRHQGLNVKRRSHCKQLPCNIVECSYPTSETRAEVEAGNIEELNVDTFLDNFKTILDDLKLTHHDFLKMGTNPGVISISPVEITPVFVNVKQESNSNLVEAQPGCSTQVTDFSDRREEVNPIQVEEVNNLKDSKSRMTKVEKVERRGRKKGSVRKKKDANDGEQDNDKDFVAKEVKNTPKRTRQSMRLRNKKPEEEHNEKTCKICKSGVMYVQCNLCEVWVHDKYLSASTIVQVNNKKDILYLCATCQ